jgi:hypothetical protein
LEVCAVCIHQMLNQLIEIHFRMDALLLQGLEA